MSIVDNEKLLEFGQDFLAETDERYSKKSETGYGHTILNESGTAMPSRSKMKFVGASVTDNSTDDKTIISINSGVGLGVENPTNVVITNADEEAIISWIDPDDLVVDGHTLAYWGGTLIVRKAGAAPTDRTDGVVVVDSKVRNQYASTGFHDTNLTNGTTYYYGIFPYSTGKVYNYNVVSQFTPSAIYPTSVSDLAAKVGNAQATVTWTTPVDADHVNIIFSATGEADKVFTNSTSPLTATGLTNGTEYTVTAVSINAKGRETESSGVNVTPKALTIVTWAQGTDEEIAEMVAEADAGLINLEDYWSVGDERQVSLSAMAATGVNESHVAQTATLVLVDMNNSAYEYVTTPASGETHCRFVVGVKNCLIEPGYMNSSATNAGGWDATARRSWCNNIFYNAIPSTLRPIFKQVKVKAMNGGTQSGTTLITSNDYFFLPSDKESLGSECVYSAAAERNALTQFEYYTNRANAIKRQGNSTTADTANFWNRTATTINTNTTHRFAVTNSLASGNRANYDEANLPSTNYIAPHGCI